MDLSDYSNRKNDNVKPKGIKVSPKNIILIRTIAKNAREFLDVKNPRIDVIELYEKNLHELGVIYEYCEKNELTNEAGITFPNQGIIKIREDVYEGAHNNSGRDRFTMCHEVGHLILHDNVSFSRSNVQHEWFEDSEWQADTFAAEFMMPVDHLIRLCRSPADIMEVFDVSHEAATLRWEKLKRQKIIR